MNEYKFRKIYLTVLWGGTLAVVLSCLGMRCLSGRNTAVGSSDADPLSSVPGSGSAQNVDAFQKMDLRVQALNVIIRTGDSEDYTIAYSGSAKFAPSYSVKDGILTVKQPSLKLISWQEDLLLTVTVPEDCELASASIDAAAGNLTLTNVNVRDLRADADAGNITVTGITASKIALSSNAGNISSSDCSFDSVDAVSNMGNVEITGLEESLADFSVNGKTNLGNISISDNKVKSPYHADGEGSGTITAKTDLGNIEIR
jgi:DUF4097 and DUF4098 domain-containing protein YvlB